MEFEALDGSVVVVTVDGSVSRIGANGKKYWTATNVGGPMITSFQVG